jgi:mxaJ protein
MIRAVAAKELDVAIAWGPQAAYFSAEIDPSLVVAPAKAPSELAGMPFVYAIAAGVRRGDQALRDDVDAILDRHRAEIDAILGEYRVPRADREPGLPQ